jgi:hypothetical protein
MVQADAAPVVAQCHGHGRPDEWRITLDLRLVLRTVPLVFCDPAAF